MVLRWVIQVLHSPQKFEHPPFWNCCSNSNWLTYWGTPLTFCKQLLDKHRSPCSSVCRSVSVCEVRDPGDLMWVVNIVCFLLRFSGDSRRGFPFCAHFLYFVLHGLGSSQDISVPLASKSTGVVSLAFCSSGLKMFRNCHTSFYMPSKYYFRF
jgi:hypothetical protein